MVVAEAAMNIACVGAEPMAVVNCLNFGNPEHPDVMWQLSEAVDGMSEACTAFNAPVVGGNVSLYNETNAVDIAPTPVVGIIGLHPELSKQPPGITVDSDSMLVLLGQQPKEDVSMAGSLWAWEIGGCKDGTLPEFDLVQTVRTAAFVTEIVQKNRVEAVHDVGEGGLAVALAEMAIQSGIGMLINGFDDHRALFNESGGRVIVALSDTNLESFLKESTNRGVPVQMIGRAGGSSLVLGSTIDLSIAELTSASRDELPQALGQGTVSG
jgi:phosphoribosylformylglycinamidine synthase